MSAEADAYREALKKYKVATEEVRQFVKTVRVIADKLKHAERVAFPNSGSFRRDVIPEVIDDWPRAEEISDSLTRWHEAHYALRELFDKISRLKNPS